MLLGTLALFVSAADTTVFNGRNRELIVTPPRVEATIAVDGVLDEPVWSQAARLVGFSSYFPTDDRPAADATEVRVWYSPTAVFFGVKAFAKASDVRATLAPRDNLGQDDVVGFFLSTFKDGRQAYYFAVNPLGVQQDGVLTEGGNNAGASQGFFGGISGGRELADPSPDFIYKSKGRVTVDGFEVEIEIPFKSIRFQGKATQDWGIHVERVSRGTGAISTWAPAKRNTGSYLSQGGTLKGLHDLHRGLVLDLTPTVTSSVNGTPGLAGRWDYRGGSPSFGGDVRWGMTSDLTLNGTVRPDFSQVEADAGQVQADPRSAIFFDEKRPFFLEGSELFETPNGLVYTRRVVRPVAASKLTGKVAGTSMAGLLAVDDQGASESGAHNPLFGIFRVQRDVGAQSKLGFLYTGRFDDGTANHVLDVDGRLAIDGRTNLDWQLAASSDRRAGQSTTAPLWRALFSRGGQRFSLRYLFDGISDQFITRSGFIGRTGVANVRLINQVTVNGKPGSLVERASFDFSPYWTWRYQDFVHGRESQDQKYHFNGNFRLKGGWSVSAAYLYEFQAFDPDFYGGHALLRPTASGVPDTVAFPGVKRLHNSDGLVSVDTPVLGGFSAHLFGLWGRDVNFFEWSRADIVWITAGVNWRPTDQLRIDGTYALQRYNRHSDGSLVGQTQIPRVKVEYQLTRSLFVRLVGQYRREIQDSLRDDTRTELPVVIRNRATGQYERAVAARSNTLQADALISFQPTPGTLIFAGYGSTRAEEPLLGAGGLARLSDGFFLKVSYLFRVN